MGGDCQHCGGQGEVPTADTAHLAGVRVGGFEHPNLCFQTCHECGGTGDLPAESLDPQRFIPEHLITTSAKEHPHALHT